MGAKTRKLSQINDSLIEWQSVVVADGSTGLTAVAGRGYFINTTAGAITVTLPSVANSKPGDTIQLKDYARTWGTNNVNIASNTFDGVSNNPSFSTDGQTVTLVFMDNTKGFSLINEDTTTGLGAAFISATGGTVTTSGNFKIHTFTGDGCFVVATVGNPAGSDSVDYLVVAGGGSGGHGNNGGGGGGSGGFREGRQVAPAYTASPLVSPTGLPVSATTYPVTVGGGASSVSNPNVGNSGSPSIFSTITSAGGGAGGRWPSGGQTGGGSGGGSAQDGGTGGSGNTPPTSPSQGNNGGNLGYWQMGGGGGAGAGGTPGHASGGSCGGSSSNRNGKGGGGNGVTTSISGSSTSYAGGGGGGFSDFNSLSPASDYSSGGTGGGANGGPGGQNGSANTGGGGSGAPGYPGNSGAGGSGVVVVRYKFQ